MHCKIIYEDTVKYPLNMNSFRYCQRTSALFFFTLASLTGKISFDHLRKRRLFIYVFQTQMLIINDKTHLF